MSAQAPASAVLQAVEPPAAQQLDGANTARALALVAAIIASVLGSEWVRAESGLVWVGVGLLSAGAVMLSVLGQRATPITVTAWVVSWVTSVGLLLGGLLGIGTGALLSLAWEGVLLAIAVLAAAAGAIALATWESMRAYAAARRLLFVRQALFATAALLLLPPAALRFGDIAYGVAHRLFAGGPLESAETGVRLIAAALVVVAGSVAAWHAPRWFAQAQLDGRVPAAAVAETTWFAALAAPLLLPVVPGVPSLLVATAAPDALQAFVTTPLETWGNAALRVLGVILVYGIVRIALGGVRSVPPVPLLVLVRTSSKEAPSPSLLKVLAELPRAWGAGPVCRVLEPRHAPAQGGVHLHLAMQTANEVRLFPPTAQALRSYRDHVPPPSRWRALPAQELYVDAPRWVDVLQALMTPDTWVLLIDEAHGTRAEPSAAMKAAMAGAPPSRTRRVGIEPVSESLLRRERHAEYGPDRMVVSHASLLADALRKQQDPHTVRHVAIAHAWADRDFAAALAARLDGQHDAQGRFVQAWHVGAGRLDLRMPVDGLRVMVQAQLHARRAEAARREALAARMNVMQRALVAANAAADSAVLDVVAGALGVSRNGPLPPYEFVWLLSEALQRETSGWTLPADEQPLVVGAQRRIGVWLDTSLSPFVTLDCQLIAAGAADPQRDARERELALTRLVRDVIDEAWVPVAPLDETVPAAAAPPEAPAAPAPTATIAPEGAKVAPTAAIAPESAKVAPTAAIEPEAVKVAPDAPSSEAPVGSAAPQPVQALCVAALPDGGWVAGGPDGELLWSRGDGAGGTRVPAHRGEVLAAIALPDGLVTAGSDGQLLLWDPRSPYVPKGELGLHRRLRAAALAGAGWVVSGAQDGSLRWWPLGDAVRHEHTGSGAAVCALAGWNGDVVVTLGAAGWFMVAGSDPATLPRPQTRPPKYFGPVCVDADHLFLGGHDLSTGKGFLHWMAWRSSERTMAELDALPSAVTALAARRDTVAFGTADGAIGVWRPAASVADRLVTGAHRGPVHGLAWLADGRLLSAGDDGVQFRDLRSWLDRPS
jgi:hypothetical protein